MYGQEGRVCALCKSLEVAGVLGCTVRGEPRGLILI